MSAADAFREALESAVEEAVAGVPAAVVTAVWNACDDERGRLLVENEQLRAELRRMAAAGKDTRPDAEPEHVAPADPPVFEYGVHLPPEDDCRAEGTVLHISENRAVAADALRRHRAVWPGHGQQLVQRAVAFGAWMAPERPAAGKDTPAGGESTRDGAEAHHERDRCMHGTSLNVECGGCDALGQIGGTA